MTSLIDVARKRVKDTPSTVFEYILMASYCYYCRYESIFKDEDFDNMCSFTLKNYDMIVSPYKHLVTKDALVAGSCFHLKIKDYPERLRWIAEEIMDSIRDTTREQTKENENDR